VVCAYDLERWGELVKCIDALRRQTRPPHDVVLVIDHNSDLLAQARERFDGVLVVGNAESKGLRGSRNTGVANAGGDILAFIDDDAIPEPDWLERLLEGYADPRVIGVGGRIEPRWDPARPSWFPSEFDWVVGCSYVGLPSFATYVRNLIGCNMSYRREAFDAGGFELGYSCDETEFCIRVGQQDPTRRFLYQPAARVHHRVSTTRLRLRRYVARCYWEGGSKAVVARLVGHGDGLASERSYVLRVLPRAVATGVGDSVRRGDPSGAARAFAVVAGLVSTAAGFAVGTVRSDHTAASRGWKEPQLRRIRNGTGG
jgi:glycosyltransferase involved in cell wall biosynthesis